jgi:hypothetical protein
MTECQKAATNRVDEDGLTSLASDRFAARPQRLSPPVAAAKSSIAGSSKLGAGSATQSEALIPRRALRRELRITHIAELRLVSSY